VRKARRKRDDWHSSFHEGAKKWRVTVPRKYSHKGFRYDKYFASQKEAEKFIADTLEERAEHGKSAVSAEDRHYINLARTELGGSLVLMPKVLAHWRKTGDEAITSTLVQDAVATFVKTKVGKGSKRTFTDITSRLGQFAKDFFGRDLHQVHSGEIENWIEKSAAAWSKKSMFKRLSPFFKYAMRQRMIAVNPMNLLTSPEAPGLHQAVYTPKQFQAMLTWAHQNSTNILLPFLGLSGLCFMRSGELVRSYVSETVLEWSDILWDRQKIHVREEVAKGTRRFKNERFVPFGKSFIDAMVSFSHRKTGRIISPTGSAFSKEWQRMHEALGFPAIPNGMRRSAISYTLAARPELGIVQASKWAGNSEATIKKHYLELLTQEDGDAWFNVPVLF
jgi:site-specific recombinase XerD